MGTKEKHSCKQNSRLIEFILWNVLLYKEENQESSAVCTRRGKKRHLKGLEGTADPVLGELQESRERALCLVGNEKGVHLKSKVRVAQGVETDLKLCVSSQTGVRLKL